MSKIQAAFADKPGFVGYLTAGDGDFEHCYNCVMALIDGGVNLIEIGVPFSDPIADGPTIEQASLRALQQQVSLQQVIDLCAEVRKSSDIPIILYSYYNPIFKNENSFYKDAQQAGINGVLVVDLPAGESEKHLAKCKQFNLDPIFLISPTTPLDRIKRINQSASGMLYYVCRNGTTGVKQSLPSDFNKKMQEIKENTTLPVVAGVGISNQAMANEVLKVADGFVVGSLFVDAAHKAKSDKNYSVLTELARGFIV